jgi:uncharacterized protein YgiM (DUF1202 family)
MTLGYLTAPLTFFVLALFSGGAAAESVLVSDIVRLRAGSGESFRTIQTLPKNTALEVIEAGPEYFQVKTADGKIGWVKSTFLKSAAPENAAPSSSSQSATVECDTLYPDVQPLRDQLARLQQEHDQVRNATLAERLYFIMAGIVLGALAGMAVLRAYYLKRLRGLRI